MPKRPKKRLAKRIRPLSRDYDHLYIDCAPGISLVSEGIFAASDALLVPTIPTTLSVRALAQLLRHMKKHRPRHLRVLPFFSMVDRRKKLHRDTVEQLPSAHPELLTTAIPNSSAVERMGLERAVVAEVATANPATRAYAALWREIRLQLG